MLGYLGGRPQIPQPTEVIVEMGKKKLIPYVGLPSGRSTKEKGKSPEIICCDISGFLTHLYDENQRLTQECVRLQERLDACNKIPVEAVEVVNPKVKEENTNG